MLSPLSPRLRDRLEERQSKAVRGPASPPARVMGSDVYRPPRPAAYPDPPLRDYLRVYGVWARASYWWLFSLDERVDFFPETFEFALSLFRSKPVEAGTAEADQSDL